MLIRNILIIGCAACSFGQAGAAPTTLQLFDFLPGSNGPFLRSNAISGDGSTVVGNSGDRAAIWNRDGTSRFLTVGGQSMSSAYGINRDGTQVVGKASVEVGGQRAYRWSSGVPVELRTIATTGAVALAVSEDGLVAVGEFAQIAVRWSPGVGGGSAASVHPFGMSYSTAWATNSNGSVIVGTAQGSSDSYAFKWTPQSGSRLLPGGGGIDVTGAYGVSSDGTIVVGAVRYGIARWVGEGPAQIITSSIFSEGIALDCSADGAALVGYARGNGGSEAVFWTEASGLVSIRTLAFQRGLDVRQFSMAEANGVSADGRTIVGIGYLSGAVRGYIFHIGDCPADFDGDLRVDFFDYLDYVQAFAIGDVAADRNGDREVDLFDYLDFVEAFSAGCE